MQSLTLALTFDPIHTCPSLDTLYYDANRASVNRMGITIDLTSEPQLPH